MGSGPSFACGHAWWSWGHPKVVRAVRLAWLEHLLPLVRTTVAENVGSKRAPDSIVTLMQQVRIRRHPRNIGRVFEGRYGSSDGFRLALATALGISISRLYPDCDVWLARTTCQLCGSAVRDLDVLAYGKYRVQRPGSQNVRPPSAVERVMAVLEPSLNSIDRELCVRGC